MILRPETFALTFLLAMMTAIGPLSTDMYLPSLPAIGESLAVGTAQVQLTLSIFLAGYAVGQIFYGPISDHFGRRPALLGALALFILGSALCALSSSIDMLILGRFVQAIGGSGPIVLARSIVRDLYEGPRAGQELSRMGSIMGLVPAIAPAFGGILQVAFGWESSFWVSAFFGILLALAVATMLPETSPLKLEGRQGSFSARAFLSSFGPMLKSGQFLAYLTMVLGTYGGLFAFISGSSFVLQTLYGLDEILFGIAFGCCALSYVIGAMIASRLVIRFGTHFVLRLGVASMVAAGLIMMLAQGLAVGHAIELVAPMMLYMIGVGLTLPQSMAQAIMPFPKAAGAASSLVGFVQMSFGALVGIIVGHQVDSSAWPLALMIALCALISFLAFIGASKLSNAAGKAEA